MSLRADLRIQPQRNIKGVREVGGGSKAWLNAASLTSQSIGRARGSGRSTEAMGLRWPLPPPSSTLSRMAERQRPPLMGIQTRFKVLLMRYRRLSNEDERRIITSLHSTYTDQSATPHDSPCSVMLSLTRQGLLSSTKNPQRKTTLLSLNHPQNTPPGPTSPTTNQLYSCSRRVRSRPLRAHWVLASAGVCLAERSVGLFLFVVPSATCMGSRCPLTSSFPRRESTWVKAILFLSHHGQSFGLV